ncbi:MAG TPA: bifunctional UDP-N-acetylglucosamine diphosphorylase/glucosamine-1-phosphate N-acetyltransferase GlmU [Kineosporiaceae bacterium]|nr:bifunctional UDP-N-acetylglucosamine diphosphorylase/glucosamine-1-phosphate N-acetyltransferase GlmU [Kineosporiaceae bacterium]
MSTHHPAAVIVLAAGEGTRMKSATPKVLHAIGGRSLLGHALAAARSLDPDSLVVVIRHERDAVAAHVAEVDPKALIADQDEIKGTGRAVECGLAMLAPELSGTVVVTYGDVPLLTPQTLDALVAAHVETGSAVTVLTAEVPDPTGYGRVLRGEDGEIVGIVEHKDATPQQRAIREMNSGIYAFDATFLAEALGRVGTDNAQGEKYLTEVLRLAVEAGLAVTSVGTEDLWEVEGVNDRVQLAALGRELNRRVLDAWMRAGVTVIDPATTWVDVQVRLAPDVTLLPGVQLHGQTQVDPGATVGPDTTLTDCLVEGGASVVRSHGSGARIRPGATVGPFSFLRPGTDLGARGKIGAFVETKNAVIGTGSKVPHLSYVGDATIGSGANIGAATVFVNYDGVHKHHTTVGDQVRIGSDTMLVAPVTIGDGAYTAAGSVITEDVPPGAMAVARGRQRNVEGWVQRRRAGSPAAAAADSALAQSTPPAADDGPTEGTPQ